MAGTDVTTRAKLVHELRREFPEDYVWVDGACVVFTTVKERSMEEAEENSVELHRIIQKYRHIFGEVDTVAMPGIFHLQVTFYSKGVCLTCGRL